MTVLRALAGLFLAGWIASAAGMAQPRPQLVIARDDVRAMRESAGAYPLFDACMAEARNRIDAAIRQPLSVPLPQDAGGPTHEQHKKNYADMQLSGMLFAVTGEDRYARFVRDLLLRYARMYPDLGKHPMAISDESSGRLFWQTLNETVWLVHVAQAYDCVHDGISPADRKLIEEGVLLPMARFLVVDRQQDLDRIHNHGTWMAAAVGMLGYALRDRDLVEKALYGSRKDRTAGFFRQLDLLFSPDGYYAEGPYYARYALMPFFLFALAIEHNQPGLKIFSYRDNILEKALVSALQLTNTNGEFFPFNDALKGMSFSGKELVLAVDVVFGRYGGNPGLLSVAARQGRVVPGLDGIAVARALAAEPSGTAFPYRSVELRDGPEGDRGAIGVLRAGAGCALVMKYGSQGMGHGHFDRLTFLYYDQGREVVQDYGAARWINIETKFGGRYLPENATWAKQTIAHNTVTVDGMSHYEGKTAEGELHPGQRRFFKTADTTFQVMSAQADEVSPGVALQRTMALIRDPDFRSPLVFDLLRVSSTAQHQYDLPLYYNGQMMSASIQYRSFDRERRALGSRNGYQHLWLEAEGKGKGGLQYTWLNGERYYTVTSGADSQTSVLFTRIGAGDPDFNLRNEPGVMLRRSGSTVTFASVIEPHGYFDPVEEISTDARPAIRSVRVLAEGEEGTVVEIRGKGSRRWIVSVSVGAGSDSDRHRVTSAGRTYEWTGNAVLEREP